MNLREKFEPGRHWKLWLRCVPLSAQLFWAPTSMGTGWGFISPALALTGPAVSACFWLDAQGLQGRISIRYVLNEYLYTCNWILAYQRRTLIFNNGIDNRKILKSWPFMTVQVYLWNVFKLFNPLLRSGPPFSPGGQESSLVENGIFMPCPASRSCCMGAKCPF